MEIFGSFPRKPAWRFCNEMFFGVLTDMFFGERYALESCSSNEPTIERKESLRGRIGSTILDFGIYLGC
jgi:hypothetical protein